jgi:pimeloyl-ACP methyl ester carboxylesterase
MQPRPVVFVPGMMLDGGMYAAQIAALADLHPTSVADITRSNSVEQLARDALAAAPERFALIGLSMGGIVALEMLRQAPHRVTHLALLDTTANADRPERGPMRLEQMAAVERGELAQVLASSMKPLYLAQCNRRNAPLLEKILRMGLALGAPVFQRQSIALKTRRDNRDLLPSIDCPTLVLCGREDQLCPLEIHVEMAAAMPRADLVVLAESGHLPTMERPEAVAAALQQLLRRH